MENNRDIQLEEMRAQLNLLREKLDAQTEINDRQLRKALRTGTDSIQLRDNIGVVAAFVAALFVTATVYFNSYPMAFVVATGVFLALNVVMCLFLRLGKVRIAADNMVDTGRQLVRYRRNNQCSLAIGMICVIAWSCWYLYETAMRFGIENPKEIVGLAACVCFGGCIGFCIGYFGQYRPNMKKAQALLDQIEEVTGTTEP
ncbi:MAG: hypothetical protein HUK02_08645 [Bacteroidaceae bacterium]|nr:hypothetical protein [Bacteroidaceae bacterium]